MPTPRRPSRQLPSTDLKERLSPHEHTCLNELLPITAALAKAGFLLELVSLLAACLVVRGLPALNLWPARYKDVPVSGPKIPHLKAAPAYSISQKTAFGSMLSNIVKTPGPCAYKHVDTDVFKNRAPKYTIVERNLIPGDTTLKPGPARYRPENVNLHKNYPKYTFGIHHSEFLAPLIVAPSD
ncbi:hypothetical protein chiPu_0019225 [Chiloscyllium punctatum]|uniref:Uncharacterized protein n=1 Tax=Chiloscyllium punctatum TaxID=137246 RepID=A0A401RRE5_CHIPU|nr:hypothetical protein [Chiloscyllium punctatum]